MTNEDKNQQKIPSKYEIVIAVFVPAIALPTLCFALFVAPSFGFDLKRMSFFLAYRAILGIVLVPTVIPVAILGEFMTKNWKKRKFSWKSAFAGIGIFGIFLIVTFSSLTVLDFFLSGLNIVWQTSLASICSVLGLIVMALVINSKRFKKLAKEKLGW